MLEKVEILLNGEKRIIPAGSNLEDLVSHLGLRRDQVAIEVNREIVKKERWDQFDIAENDEIEIVHFVGGG
jgi:thiamine biosynthesis protein ThiS